MSMTRNELEEIRDAICDTHKCGPNCPNRRAEINNWDAAADCYSVPFYRLRGMAKKASENTEKGA